MHPSGDLMGISFHQAAEHFVNHVKDLGRG